MANPLSKLAADDGPLVALAGAVIATGRTLSKSLDKHTYALHAHAESNNRLAEAMDRQAR